MKRNIIAILAILITPNLGSADNAPAPLPSEPSGYTAPDHLFAPTYGDGVSAPASKAALYLKDTCPAKNQTEKVAAELKEIYTKTSIYCSKAAYVKSRDLFNNNFWDQVYKAGYLLNLVALNNVGSPETIKAHFAAFDSIKAQAIATNSIQKGSLSNLNEISAQLRNSIHEEMQNIRREMLVASDLIDKSTKIMPTNQNEDQLKKSQVTYYQIYFERLCDRYKQLSSGLSPIKISI